MGRSSSTSDVNKAGRQSSTNSLWSKVKERVNTGIIHKRSVDEKTKEEKLLDSMQKAASKMQEKIDGANQHIASITNSERTSKTHSKANSKPLSKQETVTEESSDFDGADSNDEGLEIAEVHL